MSVGLITSAATINAEMAAEFGALPPAFLPVGNARLFARQAELLAKRVDRVVLSLPQSFVPADCDFQLIQKAGIEIVHIPDGISLAESVLLSIIACAADDQPLTILHGDTLFLSADDFPTEGFSVHRRDHPYPWAAANELSCSPAIVRTDLSGDAASGALVSGLFAFRHSTAFLKCLSRHKDDFVAALNDYAAGHGGFRAVRDCGEWLDFGHLNTYYDSRRLLTTERAFNALDIRQNIVTKTSRQTQKMVAEAHWFENLPAGLRRFVPAYLGRMEDGAGYRLDYEYLCPLNDLFVFGALPPQIWRRILVSCEGFLAECRRYKPDAASPHWHAELYGGKTTRRLYEYARGADIDLGAGWRLNGRPLPSLREIMETALANIAPMTAADTGLMHGDFCLSNILFDFRRGSIKLIDPRGYIEPGTPAIHGDTRYDVGKLHHSICGLYDMLVAGYFDIGRHGAYEIDFHVPQLERQAQVRAQFEEIVCGSDAARLRTADAISILLFLSMLPLHGDRPERQLAFLANALRLYGAHFG
jgi:Phosphotransferase enzyme family